MRIIAGEYKNRRIEFTQLNIRPTTDFAKESLFNILNNMYDFKKTSTLDLFAGSGNISYEFISRGCYQVTSIEKNINCTRFIKSIKSKLNMINLNVKTGLVKKYLNKTTQQFDIIFADPPYKYNQNDYNQIIELVFSKNILNLNGILIIEHSKFIKFDNSPFLFDTRKYGSVNFTFFNNEK